MPGVAGLSWAWAARLAQAAGPLLDGEPLLRTTPGAVPSAVAFARVPAPGTSTLVLVSIALFAVIGYRRALARIWQTTLAAGVAYVLVGSQWGLVASWANTAYQLFVFAIVRRGILADDPAGVWRSVSQSSGLVPGAGPVAEWQIALYAAAVLAGYLVGGLVAAPPPGGGRINVRGLMSRLLGALLGGVAGLLSADFVLQRVFPTARPADYVLGSSAGAAATGSAPAIALGLAALVFVLGVLNLGGRKKQVYD